MINVLPPQTKAHYRYARHNTLLRKWILLSALALAGLVLLGGGGYLYLQQTSNSYAQPISAGKDALQRGNIDGVSKQVGDISDSLKLSVKVLSKEVLFSELLKQLATLTPSNASLAALTIDESDSALDISAATTDYNAATQLQVNLASPGNKIFTKADIVSISCTGGNTSSNDVSSKYPCNVTIRALLAKDNPFLFINNTKAGS